MHISINTNDNQAAAVLLDFYGAIISTEDGWIGIAYENIDQIPAICRILVEADIDVRHIAVID